MKGPLVQVDNLDDRRTVWNLLRKLSPSRRLAFLTWCCQHAKIKRGRSRPFVNAKTVELATTARWDSGADERLHHEVWGDLWMLANNFEFDLDSGLKQLELMARRA